MTQGARSKDLQQRLRELPAVNELAGALGTEFSRAETISAAKAVLEVRRRQLVDGADDCPDLVARVRERLRPSIRRVLNATGVVIHTNLGRAPLPAAAVDALLATAAGYSNLEYDLGSGTRVSRETHVRLMLGELTGAEDATVVNNGAAALLLAVAALAPGHDVVVSRGHLVEIGGGFRIPEVVAQAGVRLLEVGTTNRTRLADYERALVQIDGAGVILRVHQSNFRTVGFVEEVPIESLCTLGVGVIDDVGSGVLAETSPYLLDEPGIRRSVVAGASLVCFSGDKLLGGPQAGLIVGQADAISACRAHPLARALRIGRLPLAALEATLALYRDPERASKEIPVLSMLMVPRPVLDARARRLAEQIGGTVIESVSRVGGGALPLLELRGPAVTVGRSTQSPTQLAAALRAGEPPLISRIADGAVLLDPRTLGDDEIDEAARVVNENSGGDPR